MGQKSTHKPGERVGRSAQVEIIRRGRPTGVERTVVKGEPYPPTPKKGDRYVEVDATKHQPRKR